ncbi:MAG: ABC transporter substrate-binding protein [Desulfobacteraceae bacterium]|nr:ABC transporter substrate-binding protein [Desulfobacteraceae bacterium]MBC2750056.1 ABC transporter substrate-binding protein [Desulfobacteraceae bacterium]
MLLTFWGAAAAFAATPTLEPVTIQLRWSHQFQFAGYYAAVEKGFYAAEGLDVTLQAAVPGQDRVTPVLEGRAQYGVGDAGILKLRADGRPLVVLAQIFQHSPGILMTRRDSDIYSPYELKGKTVLLNQDPAGSAAVRAMILETLGSLDQVNIIPRHYADEEFTGGKADAVAGYLSNEPYRMKQAGLAINIIDPRSYGIDFYGDNLFTTEQEIASHPERVEKVRRATLRGWAYALQHKEEVIDQIRAKYDPGAIREKLDFESKVVEQMILPDLVPIGELHPGRYGRIAEIFYRLEMSPSAEVPKGFLYRSETAPAVKLTAEERAWLDAHPAIRFGYSNDFQPALIVQEEGRVSGILKDTLDLLNERLGTDFGIAVTDLESLRKMARNKEVSGILSLSPAAAGRLDLIGTASHIRTYPTIFGRSGEAADIKGIEDLTTYRCAFVGGMPTMEALVASHADQMSITRVKTVLQGLKLLHEGTVDFFIGFSQHNYVILKNGLLGLGPVLTMTDRPIDAVMGVRKDWPQLVGILNKGLASITEAERSAILARWSGYDLTVRLPPVSLSPEERTWLVNNIPIRIGVADFPPFVILGEGRPTGLFSAYLELIAERTGLQFRYEVLKRFPSEALEELRQGLGPDLIPYFKGMTGREQDILFTKPYAQSPSVIFSKQDGPLFTVLEDLSGKVVGLTKPSGLHEAVIRAHPDISVRLFDTERESLQALEEGRIHASIGNLNVGTYLILENGWSNLKIVGPSGLEDQMLSFAIRPDRPELRRIIDKGLDSISLEERNTMRNQYLAVRYDHGIRKADVAKALFILGSVFGLVICAVVLWNFQLKRKVFERTADLNQSNVQLSAEIVQRQNTEKALRESRDYLDNLTNSMVDIVISVRLPDRTIEWVNDAIRQLGYEPGECIGRTTEFIYSDHDDFIALGKEMTRSMAENRENLAAEFMFKNKNGDIFPAEITISFFENKGDLIGVTGIIRDISERKEKEQLLDAYQQRLKALASKLTMSEERERRRVATELHDHVGQSLAIARLQLASAQKSNPDASCTLLLEEVSHTLLEASRETRHLIFDLSTPVIKELGLRAAIADWLNEKMPQHGIAAELADYTDSAGALSLTDDQATLLFRHTRELLTNVIKHAKANRVTVEVTAAADEIHIAVQDNGVGFETAGAPGNGKEKDHFGLFSIRESMADMGGSMVIDAAPGKGCRAVLRMPVRDKSDRSQVQGSEVQG